MNPLIDLHTTPLRDEWTQADLAYVLRNERLLAHTDAIIRNPLLETNWSQIIGLIWQRKMTVEDDYIDGGFSPRDLDLTPTAYGHLANHVYGMMVRREIARDPTWPQRFPELYNYDPATLPEASWGDEDD